MNEKVKSRFIEYLKKNNHRITNERFLILDSALSMDAHFDADELHNKMKKDYIKVSRATVYNTLELMNDCKILTRHNFKGDRARYEKSFGRKNHYHILCLNCKKILEFENQSIEKTLSKVCESKGFKLIDHSIQVFATCKESEKCKYPQNESFNNKSGKI